MIQRTFVMIKPDGVRRQIMGDIISRFEKRGLKLIGAKMQWIDADFAKQHYTEDIAIRNGEQVRKNLLKFIVEGPVLAMVWEGINAISIVRQMVGATEPKSATPGTIRGDYAHVSYGWADQKDMSIKNVIHASGDEKDAEHEVRLWFSDAEIFEYRTVHESDIRD